MYLVSLILACGGTSNNTVNTSDPTTCDATTEPIILVMEKIEFARQSDGVAWGFDIDKLNSDSDDEEGCYHADLMDPIGNQGIDNAFSGLVPTLELTEANAAEGLLQDAINTGELLLIIKITGVDDFYNDDCVTVEVLRGEGTPIIGTEGKILDGQTFARDNTIPSNIIENVQIVDGIMLISPLEMNLPFTILDKELDFEIGDGVIRLDLSTEEIRGVLGGATPRDYLEEIVQFNEIGITDLLLQLLSTAADLYPDENGECQYLSSAFEFTALPAYLYANE